MYKYSLLIVLGVILVTLYIVGLNKQPKEKEINPEAYRIAASLYMLESNEEYSSVFYNSDTDVQIVMKQAAEDLCVGKLYEDFSCKEGN